MYWSVSYKFHQNQGAKQREEKRRVSNRRMLAPYAATLQVKAVMIIDHPCFVTTQMEGYGMWTKL